jgi:hypothetical protein
MRAQMLPNLDRREIACWLYGQMTNAKHRFAALDAWRGICALCVAVYHFCAWWPLKAPDFIQGSWVLVDFFFVLSGFVIMHSYGNRVSDGASATIFMIRRIGRLWPLNTAMLLVLLMFELTRVFAAHHGVQLTTPPFHGATDPAYLLPRLFLLQAFIPISWDEPSWSIGTEFIAYIVFCLVIVQYGVSKKRGALMAAVVVIASISVLTFRQMSFDGGGTTSVARCLLGFAFGCFSYIFYRSGRHPGGRTISEIITLTAAVALVSYNIAARIPVLAPIIFALVVVAFAREQGIMSVLMKTSPMQAIGKWSYSIYLVHMPLFRVGFSVLKQLGVEPGRGSILRGSFVCVLLISALIFASFPTYRFIEEPGREYFEGLARRVANKPAVLRSA